MRLNNRPIIAIALLMALLASCSFTERETKNAPRNATTAAEIHQVLQKGTFPANTREKLLLSFISPNDCRDCISLIQNTQEGIVNKLSIRKENNLILFPGARKVEAKQLLKGPLKGIEEGSTTIYSRKLGDMARKVKKQKHITGSFFLLFDEKGQLMKVSSFKKAPI